MNAGGSRFERSGNTSLWKIIVMAKTPCLHIVSVDPPRLEYRIRVLQGHIRFSSGSACGISRTRKRRALSRSNTIETKGENRIKVNSLEGMIRLQQNFVATNWDHRKSRASLQWRAAPVPVQAHAPFLDRLIQCPALANSKQRQLGFECLRPQTSIPAQSCRS